MNAYRPARAHAWIRSNILGLVAIFIALSGSAVAYNHLPSDSAKAKASKKAKAKAGPPGPAGPQGPAGATGARGATGDQGLTGTNGLDGTARAYADVVPHLSDACAPECTIVRSKGIKSVTQAEGATGLYCVAADGVSADDVSAAVSVNLDHGGPGLATLLTSDATLVDCPNGDDDFWVWTYAYPTGTACVDAGCETMADVVTPARPNDGVAFMIVIP